MSGSRAPGLVTAVDIIELDLDSDPLADIGRGKAPGNTC